MPAPRRVVGWISESEWKAVYCNIFHGNKEQMRTGLDVIAIWRARFVGRIPVAIEATSQLLESHLHEGGEHCLSKRQSMATAVSQFVGLLTERSLKSQLHAPPMHVRAEMLGIPEWLTSLRHDAAHGFIPSYNLLQKGIEFALNWLKVNHWQEHLKNQEDTEAATKNDMSENKLTKLVHEYLNFAHEKSPGKDRLEGIESFIIQKPVAAETLCLVLVHHNFIPLQKHDTFSKCYVGQKGDRLHLSEWAKNRFYKIFHLLKKVNHLDTMLSILSNELNYPYVSVEISTLWIDCLLEISCDCSFSISMWSKIISSMINAKVNNHTIQKALDVAQIPGGVTYDPNCRDELLVRLQHCDHSQDLSIHTFPVSNDEVKSWTLTPMDFKDCPIGIMPGQTRDTVWRDLFVGKLVEPKDFSTEILLGSKRKSSYVSRANLVESEKIDCYDFDLL